MINDLKHCSECALKHWAHLNKFSLITFFVRIKHISFLNDLRKHAVTFTHAI